MVMQYVLVHPQAKAPERADKDAAGYDLYTPKDIVLPAGRCTAVNTGLKLAIPQGLYGRLASRSGLAFNRNIEVGAGTIDSNFRGELRVLLRNHSDVEVTLEAGSKIAQLILEPYVSPKLEQVERLDQTSRGEAGFGSTDAKQESRPRSRSRSPKRAETAN
jgi:dUTP pyrophosphatase